MPGHQRLRSHDLKNLEDGWKPAIKLDGENRRSLLFGRAWPQHLRPNTISCCRSAAFSVSSRAFDLNGETKIPGTNQRSRITRSAYAIRPPPQWKEIFGTHSGSNDGT